ncbi:MAG TPA: aldo/keto reductase [Anaerovoracaceae bacterium]|nr:aldo/keto reductase [Anaerovoracaceae bacterium]
MQYRSDPKSGNKLSVLGFGCMRFPRNLTQIDMNKSERLILKAIENGVNYFDTAYVYGGSEEALGAILHKNNVRNKVFIATKLPHAKCLRYEDFDLLFRTQLERLKTDYIDYYLIHNLSDIKNWDRLCGLGIEKWIAEKKDAGEIKQIGFSFHGMSDEFSSLLDAYDWDFCQIQYNYVNTHYQAGTAGLRRAAEKGMPVIVMEPLLGGKLANGLPQKAVNLFKNANAMLSPAAWALRWLWNQKEVSVVLSGMNDDAQLKENLELAGQSLPDMLTDGEKKIFDAVTEAFRASYKIPCTGCNYCMPCPRSINIPACFSAYNMSYTVGFLSGLQQYITSTGSTNPNANHSPNQCVKCGKCEEHCPQHIQIRDSLNAVTKRMEPFWFQTAIKLLVKLR